MSGDTSTTDVVSSGFGPGLLAGTSFRPAEVALVASNSPLIPTLALQQTIAHRMDVAELRSEFKGLKADLVAQFDIRDRLNAAVAENIALKTQVGQDGQKILVQSIIDGVASVVKSTTGA